MEKGEGKKWRKGKEILLTRPIRTSFQLEVKKKESKIMLKQKMKKNLSPVRFVCKMREGVR